MSIELSGPQGFEYQYLITLEMAMHFLKYDNLSVYVENNGFEDAQFSYSKKGRSYNIDLQVKHKAEEISFKEFCSWLVHFKARSSDEFILERIQQSEDNYLFIITNTRCTDAVSKFLCREDTWETSNLTLSNEYLCELKRTILEGANKEQGIAERRYIYLKDYFSTITNAELRQTLKRVKVVEYKKSDDVIESIYRILKTQYYVPESECSNILSKLLEHIRTGRDKGENIISDIKKLVELNNCKRILPYDEKYCERKEFNILCQCLEDNHILLLTGIPFSGKTYLAKALAQKFQDRGYYIKRSETFINDNEAFYFLQSPDNDLRLLLLEDPFGHITLREDAHETWEKIAELINGKIASNRMLIITTRKDILLKVCNKKELKQCHIWGNNWWDTSATDCRNTEVLWKKCYGDTKESIELFNSICDYLQKDGESALLEIGEIRHLYVEINDIKDLKKIALKEIVNKAKISSDEVCRKISSYEDENYKNLFILLGCFCNTIRGIQLKDLAYILEGTEKNASIRQKDESPDYTLIDESKDDKASFPQYQNLEKLSSQEKRILQEFCRIGYLYKDPKTNELTFSHPLFHYSSQKMLSEEIEEGWDNEYFLQYISRGIGCLSRNAAMCCLISLQKGFKCDEEKSVVALFSMAMNSIFPAVRDIAILYLDQNFDKLDEATQEAFMKNIKSHKSLDTHMMWSDDECLYPISSMHIRRVIDFSDILLKRSIYTIEDIKEKIDTGEKFSRKEVYDILYSNLEDDLPLEFLEYALLYDETMIRSKAIYYIFKIYGKNITSIKEKYLSRFENHNVVYGMLKGVVNNWEAFKKADKIELVEYFRCQLERKSVSMYTKKFFENFGIEYKKESVHWSKYSEEDKSELWDLWAQLFSKWLICFPAKYVTMAEAHMSYTTEQSLQYLKNKEDIIKIGTSWLQWLKKYVECRRANDYGMSVMEYILYGTKEMPELRTGIIKEAMNEKNSNIATSHIMHLVCGWNILTEEEKAYLCQILSCSDRNDYKWLQAIALVQREVPAEIQEAICGSVFLEKKNPKNAVEVLEAHNLLEECLSMFCGFPQPFWYNGYHHRGSKELWDKIMIEVLNREQFDRCYYIALREFIDALYNKENDRFIGGNDVYMNLIQKPMHRKQIFERLGYTLRQNQDNKEMLDNLFEQSTEEEKKEFFCKLSECIELVEWVDESYGGLLAEFDFDTIKQYLLPYFPVDQKVIGISDASFVTYQGLCKLFTEKEDPIYEKTRSSYLLSISKIYEENSPKLLITDEIVRMVADTIGVTINEDILKKSRAAFMDRYDLAEKNFEENCPFNINDEYTPQNWNE